MRHGRDNYRFEFFLHAMSEKTRRRRRRERRRSLKLLPRWKETDSFPSLDKQRGTQRIKTRICYNLNNCAADEFKILPVVFIGRE